MKHRKFVKQLMATGTGRNMANQIAAICRNHREPYADAWERYKKIMREHHDFWALYFLLTLPPHTMERRIRVIADESQ